MPVPESGRAAVPLGVSVIVPVLNDARRLARCLSALDRQSFAHPFEVLVVDNGSEDDVEAVVAGSPAARLLRERRQGSYAARNLGAEEAGGEVLAFTDADCVPAPEWLEQGVLRLQQSAEPIFVGGPVDLFVKDPKRPTAAELYESLHAFPQRHYVEALSFSVTANLFVRKDIFESVGAFSDSLRSSGDREWGERAQAAGVRPVYASRVRVAHPSRRSIGELNQKSRRVHAGDARLRALRGEPRREVELSRLRPPTRSIVRDIRRLDPPTPRSKILYAGASTLVHYIDAFHRIRTALPPRGGDAG